MVFGFLRAPALLVWLQLNHEYQLSKKNEGFGVTWSLIIEIVFSLRPSPIIGDNPSSLRYLILLFLAFKL